MISFLGAEELASESHNLMEQNGGNDLSKDLPEPSIPQIYPTTLSAKSTTAHPLFSKILEAVRFLQRDDSKDSFVS